MDLPDTPANMLRALAAVHRIHRLVLHLADAYRGIWVEIEANGALSAKSRETAISNLVMTAGTMRTIVADYGLLDAHPQLRPDAMVSLLHVITDGLTLALPARPVTNLMPSVAHIEADLPRDDIKRFLEQSSDLIE